jgi:hypothetical protein
MPSVLMYVIDIGWFAILMIAVYAITDSFVLVLYASIWYSAHLLREILLEYQRQESASDDNQP